MAQIMIVEDNQGTNKAICEYLKTAGHTLFPALDGEEALNIFRDNSIDLAVLDIMLPKMSGVTILHEIRKISNIPVVMLTAVDDEWCYFDEFHVLLRDRLTASYCVAIWKMLRKKGCVPSALTQNVKDFLASPEIENIFENSDFLVLLSQAQGDRQILAKQLGISPHQLSYVTHTNSGEGLLFFGNTTIPFVDRFPQNTELYAIMTTRPEDKKQEMNRA